MRELFQFGEFTFMCESSLRLKVKFQGPYTLLNWHLFWLSVFLLLLLRIYTLLSFC